MNAALRAFVRERAGRRCEYCRLHEDDADFLSFHVEHVVAKQHGGTDDPDRLNLPQATRLQPVVSPTSALVARIPQKNQALRVFSVTIQISSINKPRCTN